MPAEPTTHQGQAAVLVAGIEEKVKQADAHSHDERLHGRQGEPEVLSLDRALQLAQTHALLAIAGRLAGIEGELARLGRPPGDLRLVPVERVSGPWPG